MMDDAAIERAILEAVSVRGAGKTICPSEVARALAADWRALMPQVRAVAGHLARSGDIIVTQKGAPVALETARGPIRLGLPSD
ncbi:DUF3253 domain-containing protein [Tateyamaria armeniaca]|uniref:DUF3253 domain-containing protein n=1 Tax=Tateyamaria armeniaca TaxID=2518930 RepID=A0ABW8UTM2_9RHOB